MRVESLEDVVYMILLIGELLFAFTCGFVFLYGLWIGEIDFLMPLKIMIIYTLISLVILDIATYKHLEKPAAYIVLGIEILGEGSLIFLSLPVIMEFLGTTKLFLMTAYSTQFKLIPTTGIILALAGIVIYTRYAFR